MPKPASARSVTAMLLIVLATVTMAGGAQADDPVVKQVCVKTNVAPDPASPPKCAKKARLGDWLEVLITEPAPPAARPTTLYLDGVPMTGLELRIDPRNDRKPPEYWVNVQLKRTAANKSAWDSILTRVGFLDPAGARVRASVGSQSGTPYVAGDAATIELLAGEGWVRVVIGIALVLAIGLIIWALRKTDVVRDPVRKVAGFQFRLFGRADPSYRRTYSLARCQLAWWSVIVLLSFGFVFAVTGDYDSVTAETVLLLGIAGGTTLLSVTVDQSKAAAEQAELAKLLADYNAIAAAAAPTPALLKLERDLVGASEGFLQDILSNVDGQALHRMQALVWSVVLGAVFVIETVSTLSMPKFSATLLALLGISNATYLGLKIPEKQVQ